MADKDRTCGEVNMQTGLIELGEYNGVAIGARPSDQMVNATAMCQATCKRWNDYWRLDETQAFLRALSTETGIPVSELVVSIRGGNDKHNQGTWVHRRVATLFASVSVSHFASSFICSGFHPSEVGAIAPNFGRNPAARLLWTQAFLRALSTEAGIPVSELVISIRGGDPRQQGTWVHRRVAIHLAQWCSPEFAVAGGKTASGKLPEAIRGDSRDQVGEALGMSGWTQAELAEREGKSQQWIAQHIRFGDFLVWLTTTGSKSQFTPRNLTERTFRRPPAS